MVSLTRDLWVLKMHTEDLLLSVIVSSVGRHGGI